MTISWGDLRKGMVLEIDGNPYEVLDYERQKMQQRAPVTRLRLRDMRTGRSLEKTFQSYSTDWTLADVRTKPAQFLYYDGQDYIFMDMESFDQYHLGRDQIGDAVNYLKESMEVEVVFYKGAPINVKLPISVTLKVEETPPGFKGDTAQGGNKPATLETGLVVQVPLHVKSGDLIRVDTRTGEYLERA